MASLMWTLVLLMLLFYSLLGKTAGSPEREGFLEYLHTAGVS